MEIVGSFPAVVLFTTTIVFLVPSLGILITPGRVSYIIVILQNDVTLPTLAFLNEGTRGSEGSLLFQLFLLAYYSFLKLVDRILPEWASMMAK